MAAIAPSRRLAELDALRGIAATLVMLFHYTTQYDRLYGHETEPSFTLPWGHYGVNLFFMISGFVIFMTLHRVRRPADFIVSRFSRLFPAYWAAMTITFLVTTFLLPLPGKSVDVGTAAMNLFMIHGLVRIPHVDNVYWTLEIEMLFYAWALLLYCLGRLDRVHAILLGALALRVLYFLLPRYTGITLSWTIGHLLILSYIPWFICGILIYRRVMMPAESPKADWLVLIAAICALGLENGPGIGLLAIGLALLLWLAATERLPWLANPLFTWLGGISYTLYLLHENIGWTVILHLQRAGVTTDLSILLAIGLALGLATVLTRYVERPAMDWIRARYRSGALPTLSGRQSLALGSALLGLFAGLAYYWHQQRPPVRPPPVTDLFRPPEALKVSCTPASSHPLRVLALGQSNAGNHGEPPGRGAAAADFFFEGACYRTAGPVPGATGRGGALWPVLAPLLAKATNRPVQFAVLAVDASRLKDWIEPGPLRDRLIQSLADQRRNGFIPDLVLWQQGEADARDGTGRRRYRQQFLDLVELLRGQGVAAPVVAALSTRCRSTGSPAIRAALADAAATDPGIHLGPDTDTLEGAMRYDGCHFSQVGMNAAARLWLASLVPVMNLATSSMQ